MKLSCRFQFDCLDPHFILLRAAVLRYRTRRTNDAPLGYAE
jgi:hypothetical protein